MDESEAKELFWEVVPEYLFFVHKECKGTLQYVKPIKRLYLKWNRTKRPKYLKIDFILEPKSTLLAKGWDIGSQYPNLQFDG